jgi:4-methyl-5(b-hydroxyethyl)-thiazole monophosphate biosynthesis
MVYVFLADGFEEIEAICPIDILRRGQISVTTVGVTGKTVTGSHGIPITSDITIEEFETNAESLRSDISADNTDSTLMLLLPGGMPGADNLQSNKILEDALISANNNGSYIAAICAAPKILGALGLLSGKKATCFPGYENMLTGATATGESIVTDGNIITSKGAGAALEFGFELVRVLKGNAIAEKIRETMQTPVH